MYKKVQIQLAGSSSSNVSRTTHSPRELNYSLFSVLIYCTRMSRLLEILRNVKNPGSFAAGGIAPDLPNSVLHIKGISKEVICTVMPKPIHLPIHEQQAKELIEKCSRAPYGRGEKTVLDTSVRRTWQLNPSEFTIVSRELNKTWKTTLAALVAEVSADLGCAASQDVSCELYKLLLYEPGGFFKVSA